MTVEDPKRRECAACFEELVDGDEVRGAQPETGILHFQIHTYPHGADRLDRQIPDFCTTGHDNDIHVHEKCRPFWEDKFNMETPVDWDAGVAAVQDALHKARMSNPW